MINAWVDSAHAGVFAWFHSVYHCVQSLSIERGSHWLNQKMSVIKLIRLFDKSIPSAGAHSVAPISSSVHLLVCGGELLHLWTTVWHGVYDCNWRQRLLFICIMGGTSLVIVDADLSSWTLVLFINSLESFMVLLSNLSAHLFSYSIVVMLWCADAGRRYF